MSRTAIVILNYNGSALLEKYLPALLENTNDAKIFVADNASTDGSVSFINTNYPQIGILPLDRNYGYAGGYNLALSKVEADYYVLLNSDVAVTAGWLPPLISLLESSSSIASVQPKILSAIDRSHFDYAGAGGGLIDKLGYPLCRGRMFNHIEPDKGQYNDTCEIFWSSGACMAVRASMFHALGGFDPEFFVHMEEIDFCWRAKRAGLQIFYTGASTVYHEGGGTLSSLSSKKTYFNFRNGLSLVFRHWRTRELIWKFPLRLLLDYLAAIRFIFTTMPGHGLAVLHAHFSFFIRINREIAKRRQSQAIGSDYGHRGQYNQLLIWQYFILGRRELSDQ